MKKVFLVSMSLIAIGLTASCGGGSAASEKVNDQPIGPNQMTMTMTANGEIGPKLHGIGDIVIDWGDGSPIDSITLKRATEKYSHTYNTEAERTIRIAGEHIVTLIFGGLSTLDVSQNPLLETLYCADGNIKVLDVSKNPELTYLNCPSNELTVLDVSNNPKIQLVNCEKNKLTALDLSNNTVLRWLSCHENELSADALNAMFSTLHNNEVKGKGMYIQKNPGSNDCDPSIATDKGWEVNNR